MIHLFQSDRAAALLDRLASDIAQWRTRIGPLAPVRVIISGTAETAMLKRGLAERLGICANCHFQPLRKVFQDILDRRAPGVHLAGPPEIGLGILDLLHRPEVMALEDLRPLRTYLETDPPVEERKLQLALNLAPLFDQYALHRPQWSKAWIAGDLSQFASEDRWQGVLFRALVRNGGPLADTLPDDCTPKRYWLLPDALHLLTDAGKHPIFIYNVPLRSEVMTEALRRIGQTAPLYLYAINPCLEYWADLSAPAEPHDAPAALRLWGRPGQEYLQHAMVLSDWNVESLPGASAENTSLTVLHAFQTDIRTYTPANHPRRQIPVDQSIQIIEAPTIRRECEAIASAIWSLAETHPDLRWSDCVVALGSRDIEHYRTHLAAAFSDAHDLPFHELDIRLSDQSRIVDIVRLLLALPLSTYARSDVLRVVTHPTVGTRFELGDTSDWVTWCDRLAIFDGADRDDHQQTYISKDVFNWDQGLRRLALGVALHTDEHQPDPVYLNEQPFVPADIPVQDLLRVGRMLGLLRSLVADARAISTTQHTLPQWLQYIRLFIETYVQPSNDHDERDLHRVQAAIVELENQCPGGSLLSFGTVRDLILHKLDTIRIHSGQPLAEAVVVGPLDNVSTLSFRFAFVPGMGEGLFPASDRSSSIDLRRGPRTPGETTPKMRDEYHFLLRVLSTTDQVCLSYVAQDPETGDACLPSSTLNEFRQILEQYVGEGQLPSIVVPLHRYIDPGHSRSALAEKQAVDVRRALQHSLPPHTPPPDLETIEALLPKEWIPRWRQRLGLWRPPPPPASTREAQMNLAHLQRFLEEPIQGWARQVLGLTQEEHDLEPLGPSTEPFELERFHARRVLEELFVRWVNERGQPSELEDRYSTAANYLELSGQMPTGVFGTTNRTRHLRTLRTWASKLAAATEGKTISLARLEIGRPGTATQALSAPSIQLAGAQLIGTTQYIRSDGGTFACTDRNLEKDKPTQRRIALGSWMAQLSWVISGKPARGTWRGCIADVGDTHLIFRLTQIVEPVARRLLQQLTDDLLQNDHHFRLPLRTQARLYNEQRQGATTAALQYILDSASSDPFGPLDANQFAPPTLDVAFAIIERRLQPFLESYHDESS